MTARELAARELLAFLEAFGCVIWIDDRERLFRHRDPERVFGQDVVDQVNDLSRELELVLIYDGCRDGYERGPTRWHVVVVRRGRRDYLCASGFAGQVAAASSVQKLPPHSRNEQLCSRCIAKLVERELARVPVVSPGEREPR